MLDLCIWRFRIGIFNNKARNGPVNSVSKTRQVKNQLTVSDVLLSYVALLALSACFLNNFSACVTSVEIFKHENISYRGYVSFATMTLPDALKQNAENDSDFVLVTVLPVVALCTCSVTNAIFILRRLLLSGDIETNPGPNHSNDATAATDKESASNQPTQSDGTIGPDMAVQILQAIQEQSSKITLLGDEMKAVRNELKAVNQKCNEINERCDRLERDKRELASTVSGIVADMTSLREDSSENKNATEELCQMTTSLREEIQEMNEEIDRLEGFSRRDNLRIFGISQSTPTEDYKTCASAVVEALNNGTTGKVWTTDDIVRAHRIGQGNHRPMIVKFRNWSDKMELLLNKEQRGTLEKNGIRVANDLTKRQAAVVAQARREGKSAYFVRGTLTVGPRKTPVRSYAEAVTATRPTTTERGADQCQQEEPGRGDSPRHVTASGSPRANSEGTSTRQASASSRGGVSGTGRGGPARADRGRQQAGMNRYLSPGSRPNTAGSDTRVLRSGSTSK